MPEKKERTPSSRNKCQHTRMLLQVLRKVQGEYITHPAGGGAYAADAKVDAGEEGEGTVQAAVQVFVQAIQKRFLSVLGCEGLGIIRFH